MGIDYAVKRGVPVSICYPDGRVESIVQEDATARGGSL